MGFLLAGFGKQMDGTRLRSLQARMMRVSNQVRRVQKDYEHMKKYIEREEKMAKSALKFEAQQANMLAQSQLNATMQGVMGSLGITAGAQMTQEQQGQYNIQYQQAQMLFSNAQAQNATQVEMKQQQLEQYYDNMKDMLLDPLKDEEDELASEKEMLESQITIARQDYEACQKMEQADAKMLAPNYTGAQG